MSHVPASTSVWVAMAVGLGALMGCESIAGLDETYVLGTGASPTTGSSEGGGGAVVTGGSTSVGGQAGHAAAGGGGHGATGGSSPAGGSGGAGECGIGYACVPAPGNATLASIQSGACSAGWSSATELYAGPDPGCDACGPCSGPVGGGCGTISVERYWNYNCTTTLDGPFDVSDGGCVNVDSSSDQQAWSYQVTVPVNVGTCTPAAGQPSPIESVQICLLEDTSHGSCSVGLCAPEATTPAATDGCVLLEGDATCPAEFPSLHALFRSYDDTRSCDCNCHVTGAACPAALRLYDNWDCTTLLYDQPTSTCNEASSYTGHDGFLVDVGTFEAGQCVADSNHSGSVTFTEPVTLCCA